MDFERTEWLETNGLGGYASSTVTGLNSRRYHGLLVAATSPPVGRMVLLSKLEESLIIGGQRFDLSENRYPGTIHPNGRQYLKSFRLDPFPIFTYEINGVELKKTVFMVYESNTTVIQYDISKSQDLDCKLEVRPLIAFRDYHATTHENSALDAHVDAQAKLAVLHPYRDTPALYLAHDADELDATGWWYRNLEYILEQERGLDYREDCFSPLGMKFNFANRNQASIIASTEPCEITDATNYRESEIARRASMLSGFEDSDEFVRDLVTAANQFVVARGDQKTIIAGYHWFGDWGRDTMIALPGLTLVTGRADIAKSILLNFAKYVDKGMLPNRFPDYDQEPEYNTVDGTLWYFEAIRALVQHTGDYGFIKTHLYDVLKDIVEWHRRGTRYGIVVDDDGLLRAGVPGVQLTWMDARVEDREITPRHGKPVEIQALWYNALRVMEHFAEKFEDVHASKTYGEMADRAKASFGEQFWNERDGCLYDVVNGEVKDVSIRPNQVIAISLEHTMVSKDRAKSILAVIEKDLLTPFGLRSLAPADPQYCGNCAGGIHERDGAYHQGTVWAWLMGPYITAYSKVHGAPDIKIFDPFRRHLREAGLGQISEIFDADAPYTPRGCIAQAWSVGEVLRAVIGGRGPGVGGQGRGDFASPSSLTPGP